MDVAAVKVIFIDAHHAFVERVDTRHRHGAAET